MKSINLIYVLLAVWASSPAAAQYVYEADQALIDLQSNYIATSYNFNVGDDQVGSMHNLGFTFDFYGVYVTYAGGIDTANDYGEIGYSTDAGPGSFSISYGEYDNMGSNYLVGYDWSVGDFTLGFYYSDFDSDAGVANDQDGGFFTISY